MAAAAALAGTWLAWAACAHVASYQVTADARVELDGAVSPIDAPFVGRIVTTRLRVGQHVSHGDVLLELDSMSEQLQLREAEVSMRGLEPQLSKLRAQIAAEESMRSGETASGKSSVREAASRIREAQIAAQYAGQDLERIAKLYAEYVVSTRDWAG